MSKIQADLRKKGKVVFEGVTLLYAGEWPLLKEGDTYIAERNDGPKLLTVARIDKVPEKFNQWSGEIFPQEKDEPYSLHECIKVEVILDEGKKDEGSTAQVR